MIFNLVAEILSEHIIYNKVLRHCFGSRSAFCYNVENGFFDVDNVKKRGHSFRIDVILDVKFGRFSLLSGEVVVMKVAKSLKNRDRTERAAADAENNEIFCRSSYLLSRFVYVRHDFSLMKG